ncbi:hypothetical protein FACS189455_4470 [Bacteroidia bacterium]|nr:hypothetical protein FACS189455_4470 [Bacteroidia bacterium]
MVLSVLLITVEIGLSSLNTEAMAQSSITAPTAPAGKEDDGSGGGGNEEYVIGPLFTNWKFYVIECTFTDKVTVIPFVYIHERSYTAKKETCGKGSGWCLGATGC